MASLVLRSAHAANTTGWKAGVSSVVIAPDKYIWMDGYAARTKPDEVQLRDLFAKALVLEDEHGQQLAIVMMDLIRNLRRTTSARGKEDFGAIANSARGLLMNASHTHSRPELRNRAIPPRHVDAMEYTAVLEDKIVRLIGEAVANLEPIVSWNFARAGFAILASKTAQRCRALPDGLWRRSKAIPAAGRPSMGNRGTDIGRLRSTPLESADAE